MAQGEVGWNNFYRYFEHALQGRAQTWYESQISKGQGRCFEVENPRDAGWATLYQYMKRTHLVRFNVHYEEPSGRVRQAWERLEFTFIMRYVEDVDAMLEKF